MTLNRSNIAVTKLEGMNNVYASSVRDSTDAKYKESGRLERDERENFIGSWVQIKGKFFAISQCTKLRTQTMYTFTAQSILKRKQFP